MEKNWGDTPSATLNLRIIKKVFQVNLESNFRFKYFLSS